MRSAIQILLLGQDSVLQTTRSAILQLDGFRVDRVCSPRELLTCLASKHFDLVVLCHSLSAVKRQVALAIAASFVPEIRLLVLRKDLSSSLRSSFAEVLETDTGPEKFRSAVRALSQMKDAPTHLKDRKSGMAQLKGTVKWFSNAKGYGFIDRSDGGADVIAHDSSIQSAGYKMLKQGHPVTFDVVKGEKGPPADQVQLDPDQK